MAKLKNLTTGFVGEDVESGEQSLTAGWIAKIATLKISKAVSQKIENQSTLRPRDIICIPKC